MKSQTSATPLSGAGWNEDKILRAAMWLGLILLAAFFVHWRLKSAYTATYSYYRWDEFGPVPDWVPLILAWRWPMRIAAGLGGAMLIAVEWRAGRVTSSLRQALNSNWGAAITLALIGLASGSYYLLPGEIALSSDALGYTGYAALARQSLALGQWPFWSNFAGMGAPHLQFYGFYPVAAALVSLLQPDLFQATKYLEFALHVISVFGMFAFVSKLTGSRAAGFAAAWAYGFAFYRYHAIVFTGVVHMGIHFALMPWQFYCLEEFITGRRPRLAWAVFSILGGLSILGHPNYGAFVIGFALLYGMVRIWLTPSAALSKITSSLWLAGGIAGSLLLGAYPVLGTVFEEKFVATGNYQGALTFALGPLSLRQVFTFLGSYWTSDWFGGYVGISVVLIALAAFALAAWQKDRAAVALGLSFALSLYLTLGPGRLPFDSIFQRIPLGWLAYIFVTPGRYLLYVTFFATAAVGLAVRYLQPNPASARAELAALFVVLVVSADMIPLAMQANALRPPGYDADAKRVYAWLRANTADPTARILDPAADLSVVDIQLYAGLPGFGSTLHDMPARNYSAVNLFVAGVLDDLQAGVIRPSTRDWLYLTNTSAIYTDLPVPPAQRAGVVVASGVVSAIGNPDHSPVIASGRIATVPDDGRLNRVLEMIEIDRQRNSAEFIPVVDGPLGDAVLTDAPVTVRTLSHDVLPQYARITYELSAPGFVQLSYAYYPYLRVILDGETIAPAQSPFGLIVFKSEGGAHTVELIPYLSPLRIGWLMAGLAFVLGAALLAGLEWRQKTSN